MCKTERLPSPLFERDSGHDLKRPKQEAPLVTQSYSGWPTQVYYIGEPYDYKIHESVPKCAAYHPSLAELKRRNKQALDTLCFHIERGGHKDKDIEIQNFLRSLGAQREIDLKYRKVVAFDGDTGTGKSTLINSVLAQTSLATEGSGGKSCTQVVAEYTDNPNLKICYELQVELHHDQVIKQRAEVHVRNYRSFQDQRLGDVTGLQKEEHDDLAHDAKTALEFCQTLFGDQPECQTKETTHDLLSTGVLSDVTDTLMEWMLNIKNDLGMPDGQSTVTYRSSNLEELQGNAARFTERMNEFEAKSMLWPIVHKVRYLINSPFLRQGIELVDLPGLSDGNADRRNATLAYLRDSCQAIIVVARADRAATLPSVATSIRRAIRLKGPVNVIVAITRIDDCKQNPDGLNQTEFAELKGMDNAVKTALASVGQAKARKASRTELRELKAVAKVAQINLTRARILVRNRHLVQEFQEEYRDMTGSRQLLRVVPVSNSIHQDHLQGFDDEDDPPCLNVEEDGIRNLRHEILKMLDQGKIENLERHLLRVSGTYTSIKLWTDRSRTDRKEIVMDRVRNVLQKWNSDLENHERELIKESDERLHQVFSSKQEHFWSPMIRCRIDKFRNEFSPQTFRALAKRFGVHKPKGHDWISMNADILAIIAKDMDSTNQIIKNTIDSESVALSTYIMSLFNQVEKDFESEHSVAGLDMDVLIKRLGLRKREIIQATQDCTNRLKEAIHNNMTRAQSEDPIQSNQYSPFMLEMREIYQELHKLRGTGVHAKRTEHMKEKVTAKDGPFLKMVFGLKKANGNSLERWVETVDTELNAGLKAVLSDLNNRFIGAEMPEVERNELHDSLKQLMPEIEAEFEHNLPLLVQQCKEWA